MITLPTPVLAPEAATGILSPSTLSYKSNIMILVALGCLILHFINVLTKGAANIYLMILGFIATCLGVGAHKYALYHFKAYSTNAELLNKTVSYNICINNWLLTYPLLVALGALVAFVAMIYVATIVFEHKSEVYPNIKEYKVVSICKIGSKFLTSEEEKQKDINFLLVISLGFILVVFLWNVLSGISVLPNLETTLERYNDNKTAQNLIAIVKRHSLINGILPFIPGLLLLFGTHVLVNHNYTQPIMMVVYIIILFSNYVDISY